MQARGETVMGVDQYTSAHVFEDLPDGGRIVLDRYTESDSGGIARVRQHMHAIAAAFTAGDFAQPFQVHAAAVPGTSVMAARRSAISYQEVDRPRGAEVRIGRPKRPPTPPVTSFWPFHPGALLRPGPAGR